MQKDKPFYDWKFDEQVEWIASQILLSLARGDFTTTVYLWCEQIHDVSVRQGIAEAKRDLRRKERKR